MTGHLYDPELALHEDGTISYTVHGRDPSFRVQAARKIPVTEVGRWIVSARDQFQAHTLRYAWTTDLREHHWILRGEAES